MQNTIHHDRLSENFHPRRRLAVFNLSKKIIFFSLVLMGLPLDGSIPEPAGNFREAHVEYPQGIIAYLVWTSIYFLAAVKVLISRRFIDLLFGVPFSFLLLVALYFASSFWSYSEDSQFISGIQVLGSIFLAFLCANEFRDSPIDFFRIAQTAMGINLLANLLSVIIFPSDTINYIGRWAGLVGNPNYLGGVALFCGTVTLVLSHQRAISGKRTLLFLGLSIVMIMGADSMTSFVSLVAAMITYYFVNSFRQKSVITRYLLILVFSTILLLFFAGIFLYVERIFAGAGRDMSATGRLLIWIKALELIGERPIFGYGMGANALNTGALHWPTHFHNSYLQIGVFTGLVGLSLFFITLLRQISSILGRLQIPAFRGYLIVIVPIIVYGLAESPVFLARNPVWIMYLFTLILFSNLALKKPAVS